MEVNVRKVLAEKNPKLARWIPSFILAYLERIIHQKEINEFLAQHGKKKGIDFCDEVIKYFNVKVNVKGLEDIPKNGRYLFVSNHPLGGFDGIILMKTINEHFGDVKVLVNDILMNIKPLENLFLPINKHGQQNKHAVKLINEAFESDVPLLTFPAGLCSRKIKGQIIDLEWKKNFITKAIENRRDIIPIYFSGRNSNFFYNLSNLRKFFGISANIEMIYLVDEMFKHRDKQFEVKFGQIIPYTKFDGSKTMYEWAQEVKQMVYQMAN